MDKQALRPEFFPTLPTFVKEAEQPKSSDDERFLYALSQNPGWRVLKEYVDSLLGDLENVTNTSMNQGLTFEEIGKNAIVASLVKGMLTRVIQKVEDAVEQVEKPDGTIK